MSLTLVIHHDADLYGADQSLLRAARALKAGGLQPVVVLPYEGPLLQRLQAEGLEVHTGPVGKLTRQRMKPAAWGQLIGELRATLRFLDGVVAGRPVRLAYINSVAAIGGGLWARLRGVPTLWHVRELVVSPRLAAAGLPWLLHALGGWCVCNSGATRDWLIGQQPRLATRSSVLWNGIEPARSPSPEDVRAFRKRLGFAPQHTVVTLVGRINRWKGQGVFVDAAAQLQATAVHADTRFLIVGDVADGQHHFREDLLARIRAAGLGDRMSWQPFTPEVDVVWAVSDITVVPSVEPEPFGRVAIEAMAHGLPVVAAGHGGLAEIVVDGETGHLVAPGDATALASALATLIGDAGLRQRMGARGRERQLRLFSQAQHDQRLLELIERLSGRAANPAARAAVSP